VSRIGVVVVGWDDWLVFVFRCNSNAGSANERWPYISLSGIGYVSYLRVKTQEDMWKKPKCRGNNVTDTVRAKMGQF
jgi:hypothetical protein